jgi:hypothetical protein
MSMPSCSRLGSYTETIHAGLAIKITIASDLEALHLVWLEVLEVVMPL